MASPVQSTTLQLLNGTKLPVLGFGVWDSPSHLTTKSCLEALKVGYKHIDTAQVYGNEAEVGAAFRESGLNRKDVWITSKIYSPGSDAQSTYQKLLDSVKKIDGESGYLDLMLIHNAAVGHDSYKTMWQAMEKLHEEGKLKSIGVSNFGIGHLEDLKKFAKAWPPAVNQLELHPWLQQREVIQFCQANRIVVEAYCPLVRNQKADDPVLNEIAKKHSKTTAQVLVRYAIEKGWSPLPKSDNPGRIAQNADVFDFKLDVKDMEKLDSQPQESALVLAVDNKSHG
ncbi:Aldo/keto reductase [Teratosphaeria nubilosa]|uniref:Aldo/keto reductase n=1 Tax=Teratosphaeria nubilosa TaxID=161662 RepID=A0A6G1KV30_9PEZI|nr:Aldo/keto reductase [Teratosphaeria nubilosa]